MFINSMQFIEEILCVDMIFLREMEEVAENNKFHIHDIRLHIYSNQVHEGATLSAVYISLAKISY